MFAVAIPLTIALVITAIHFIQMQQGFQNKYNVLRGELREQVTRLANAQNQVERMLASSKIFKGKLNIEAKLIRGIEELQKVDRQTHYYSPVGKRL